MTMSAKIDPFMSVQFWQAEQVAVREYRFMTDRWINLALDNPDKWGRAVIIDAFRISRATDYPADWCNYYDRRTDKREDVQECFERFLDLGKMLVGYMGGVHQSLNAAAYETRRKAGEYVKWVQNLMSIFAPFRADKDDPTKPSPLLWVCVDGADTDLCQVINSLGYNVMCEDFPWPTHPCRDRFATLAKDVNAEKWAGPTWIDSEGNEGAAGHYDAITHPGPHHIWGTDDDVLARSGAKWLHMGRVIHGGPEWIGKPLPGWYAGALASEPEGPIV